jgi:glycosyltransferase involved in cell wall biosynthesis
MSESPIIRLCFICPKIYPLFNPLARGIYGETEIQIYELIRFFSNEQSIEISVITGNYDQNEVEFYSGVMVFRSEFSNTERKWYNQLIPPKPSEFDLLLKKVDSQIYFVAGAYGFTEQVANFCKKKKNTFIYRVTHQNDCDGTFVHGNLEDGPRYKNALHNADYILCQSNEQKSLIERTENIAAQVIPNAIYPEPLSDEPKTDVLWIGEVLEWKQPEFLFRLALTVPESNFTWLVKPSDRNYFEKLIDKTRDIPNLGVENSVPYHEWDTFFRRAKLLVNTSRYEGFPYTFTRAFSYGIPVVSLNVDPDGLIDQYQMGICAEGSEVRFCQGVMDLLAYERQWKRMSNNAYKFVSEHQNFKTIGQTYLKIFLGSQHKGKKKRK